jgi:uncharacterized delta-60 repeat protein
MSLSVHIRAAVSALAASVCLALMAAAPTTAAAATAGSIDTSFGSNGATTVAVGPWSGASAIAVQPDQKIVTAGEAAVNGIDEFVATRMTSSGRLDPTFGSGGVVTININGGAGVDSGDALVIQPDGKIVIVGGGVAPPYGPLSFAAVRLLPNGAPDRSFGSNGIAIARVGQGSIATGVVLQPDGKLAVAGTAIVNGQNQFAAARFNANGTVDASFGSGGSITVGGPIGGAWGLARQPTGKLVLVGQANYGSAAAQEFMAVRLMPNGTRDPSFGSGGIDAIPVGASSYGFGIAVQSDGKVVLAGPAFTTTGVNATVRLRDNGSLDTTYGHGGIATVNDWYGANGLVLDSADNAVIPTVGSGAVRITKNGVGDASFGTGGVAMAKVGSSDGANGAAIQADGKIVLGSAVTINGVVEIGVIRLNGGGTAKTASITSTATTHGIRQGSLNTELCTSGGLQWRSVVPVRTEVCQWRPQRWVSAKPHAARAASRQCRSAHGKRRHQARCGRTSSLRKRGR